MIEHLMSSSLSGDHQGCAAGFIRLHVRGLRSHQWLVAQELIARVVVCATGAVHTDIFRSIRYLPNPVPRGALNPSRGQSARTRTYRPIEITRAAKRRRWRCMPSSLSKHPRVQAVSSANLTLGL